MVFWWLERDVRRRNEFGHCISNMCLIDAAKEQYAIAHGLTKGNVVTRDQVAEYIKGGWQNFDCFAAGGDKYDLGVVGEDPKCPVHGSLHNAHLPDGSNPYEDSTVGRSSEASQRFTHR